MTKNMLLSFCILKQNHLIKVVLMFVYQVPADKPTLHTFHVSRWKLYHTTLYTTAAEFSVADFIM